MRYFIPFLICFTQILSAQDMDSLLWHHDGHNAIKNEGHKKNRAYYKQRQEERNSMVIKDGSRGALDDTLPTPLGTEETYANGMLKGKWRFNKITHSTAGGGYGSGVRLDRIVYNPDSNQLFALNASSNLLVGYLNHRGTLSENNQVVKIAFGGFAGVKTSSGLFRLIGAINGEYKYSDDRGMTWKQAAGGTHNVGAAYWTEVMSNGDILVQLRKKIAGIDNDVILRSTDFGMSYSALQTWPTSQSDGIVSTKFYNTNDYCLIIRKIKGQNSWEVNRYENGNLSVLATVTSDKIPKSITGTYSGGWKSYIGVSGGGGYYTNGGLTFQWIAGMKEELCTVHPDDPNWIMSKEARHDYSIDGGNNWSTYPNNNSTIGWDPKHVFFYKIKGNWVLIAANDMGLCYNEDVDPLNTATWKNVNDNHVHAIMHGGIAVDNTGLLVTGNQDPGTFELSATGYNQYNALNKVGADGLRLASSNNGKAYWFRHYWSSFYHNHAGFTNDNRQKNYDITADWYTPPFKGSTKPGEDAIYVSGYDTLFKLVYNTANNTITRVNLNGNFKSATGEVTYGIGVSKSDPSRLYVATKNGRFYYSTDTGKSWTETSYTGAKPIPQTWPTWDQNTGFYIEVADENPDLVYWGSGKGSTACLISNDGGKTFTSSVNGLAGSDNLQNISLSPDGKLAFSSNFFVYIASENKWFPLRGASWPTGAFDCNGVYYLPLQNRVQYFTYGAGVVDFDITYLNTTDFPYRDFAADSCYRITALHSGKVLEVASGSTANGAIVQQGDWVNGDHQKWKIIPNDGFYKIVNVRSGKTLDVNGGGISDGTSIIQYADGNSNNQRWNIQRNSSGYYAIAAKHSYKVLDVTNSSMSNGAVIKQMTSMNTQNQTWTLTAASDCSSMYTSINKIDAAIEIYPNPSSTSVTIELKGAPTKIRIYNSMGSLVYTSTHELSEITIPVEQIGNRGIYFVHTDAMIKKLIIIQE